MQKYDLHVHSTFSDGKSTPEEIVLAAIDAGLDTIGISDHSYTAFDEGWCMKKERLSEYVAQMSRLKEKYRDRITVLCGLEKDLYSDVESGIFDYMIGSVHYVKCDDEYVPIDEKAECHKNAAEKYFGNDIYAFVRAYYENVALLAKDKDINIIGHFDLVTKFIEKEPMFSVEDKRYKEAWRFAADSLLKRPDLYFEINTGAISRGYRTTPYPSSEILDYLKSHGAKFIFSSDAHEAKNLRFLAEKYREK